MANKTFLVPLDGSEYSERALPVATVLADRLGADLLLVCARDRGPLAPSEYLEEQAAGLRAGGSKVDTRVVSGRGAGDAIANAAAELDDPVVCMTTHGRGRLRWAALGSVAEEVLRRAEHPTVLVGRHCRHDFLVRSSQLLACVDGEDAAAVLAPPTDEWAARLGLTVDVATVVHPLDVITAERERAMRASLRSCFAHAAHATMITNRFPAGALADVANTLPAALVAINGHARERLSRFALGSVTMGVVHMVDCPVLVVHSAEA